MAEAKEENPKNWSELSADEQKAVFEKVAAVYEKHKDAVGDHCPKVSGENVYNLTASNFEGKTHLTCEVVLKPDQKDLSEELTKELKDACASVSDAKVDVSCKYAHGDKVTTITDVSDIRGGDKKTITHNEGEVWLLDFWATWCPPCQRPMAHNQEMCAKNKEAWKGKVRIIGLSIDNDHSTVAEHVDNKQWGDVEHYHVRNGTCNADKEYGVRGVPHCLLIDTHGKIVFIGHPASRPNLEEDINTLKDGKTISGEGCSAADEGEGGGASGKKITADVATPAIEEFKKDAQEIMDSSKDAVSGMPRAFLVLTVEGKYDWKTKALTYKLDHYQVFVGSQEKIDGLKEASKGLRDAGKKWTVIERSQAI